MNDEYRITMKHKLLLYLFVCSTLYCSAQNSKQVTSATVNFVFIDHDVDGTISGFDSSSTIDFDDLENAKLKGSVAVETISTGNSLRNWSLRRGKYFDADNYPKITFESNTIKVDGDVTTVTGSLTIKDVTKEVSFKFTRKENQLIGKTVLYSSDYGIKIKKAREENKVTVEIVLQLK